VPDFPVLEMNLGRHSALLEDLNSRLPRRLQELNEFRENQRFQVSRNLLRAAGCRFAGIGRPSSRPRRQIRAKLGVAARQGFNSGAVKEGQFELVATWNGPQGFRLSEGDLDLGPLTS